MSVLGSLAALAKVRRFASSPHQSYVDIVCSPFVASLAARMTDLTMLSWMAILCADLRVPGPGEDRNHQPAGDWADPARILGAAGR